jgi:hypothetical protein
MERDSTEFRAWFKGCGLSPYRVICRGGCGPVNLTDEEYSRQLARPNQLWMCTKCGGDAYWDDTWYEGFLDDGPDDDGSELGASSRPSTLNVIVVSALLVVSFFVGWGTSEINHCYLLKDELQDPLCLMWGGSDERAKLIDDSNAKIKAKEEEIEQVRGQLGACEEVVTKLREPPSEPKPGDIEGQISSLANQIECLRHQADWLGDLAVKAGLPPTKLRAALKGELRHLDGLTRVQKRVLLENLPKTPMCDF